jgi:hypothetical protein
MPLWEFKLPAGGSWADYEEFSIEYYVSKDSKIVELDVRSRLYGAYLAGDFIVPDPGDINGWGGFRMVNWNTNPMTNEGRADQSINPNNDFIIDNSRGTAAAFGTLFTAESGAASKWFTVKYTTNAGIAKDFAKVPQLDSGTVDAIYVGAGIFGPGGNTSDAFEFYAKNPTLVHKTDPTKNIAGASYLTGTTEKLFAGNFGSAKAGTDRETVTGTDWMDVEGEIMISFNLASGTGDFPPARIMAPAALGAKFPAVEPTREGYEFLGWFYGAEGEEQEATAETVFEVKTTLTAKWELTAVVSTYTVDLTGVTVKNAEAWSSSYNAGLLFPVGDGFSAGLYDKVEIICKFYAADGTTEVTDIPASNFQVKFHAVEVDSANGNNVKTEYNFGQGAPAADGGGLKITYTLADAVKSGGLWGIGIQTSGGSEGVFAAQFVEVISITFPAPAPAAE